MTLKTICDDALKEISGFDIPPTYVGSTIPTAQTCVALLQRAGRTIARKHDLTALLTDATITTASGTNSYALESDFRKMADETQWNRTDQDPMFGPLHPVRQEQYASGVIQSTSRDNFWIQGGLFYVYPTPSATETLAYKYYSKNWITKQSDSTTTATWESDNDTSLIDEDILTLALKWMFLQSKGMPYDAEYDLYMDELNSYIAQDGGSRIVNMAHSSETALSNIPETGFGS